MSDNTERELIVVDTETNGLDPMRHQIVEVAWQSLGPISDDDPRPQSGVFIPPHSVAAVLGRAHVKALQVNRYVDRLADAQQVDWGVVVDFWQRLDGATLVGANPRFDAAMLANLFRGVPHHVGVDGMAERPEPWHHRLWDIEAYASGVLGLREVLGLQKLSDYLDVAPGDHTAAEDVRATVECFRRLMDIAAEKRSAA